MGDYGNLQTGSIQHSIETLSVIAEHSEIQERY